MALVHEVGVDNLERAARSYTLDTGGVGMLMSYVKEGPAKPRAVDGEEGGETSADGGSGGGGGMMIPIIGGTAVVVLLLAVTCAVRMSKRARNRQSSNVVDIAPPAATHSCPDDYAHRAAASARRVAGATTTRVAEVHNDSSAAVRAASPMTDSLVIEEVGEHHFNRAPMALPNWGAIQEASSRPGSSSASRAPHSDERPHARDARQRGVASPSRGSWG
eukprot:1184379-Prorocentrum_minimum.AAC.1